MGVGRVHVGRLPLLAVGMATLVAATCGGLARVGWPLHAAPALAAFHGPLMVAGFLGTLIALERAVALRASWAYGAPLLVALGIVALVAGAVPAAMILMAAGSAWVVVVFVALLRRQAATFVMVMTAGAVAFLGAQLLWLGGWPVHRVAPWWAAFLTLTIAAERLELNRLLRPSPASRAAFLGAVAAVAGGPLIGLAAFTAGQRVLGAGLVALAVWLGTQDIARRTVRQAGLTRFIAIALLAGYVWLGAAGGLVIVFADVAAGPAYDATLHALFLGFVFSMIFGHAPVIFPAVLGPAMAFGRHFYVHLVLLHATLVVRLAGDLVGVPGLRRWGALGNGVSVVLFLVVTALAVLTAYARGRGARGPASVGAARLRTGPLVGGVRR